MKEWYLTDNYKPTATSGYESDVISEFAESNFNDVLETTFSDTVLLYSSDMTECQEIQCVIQGNSADTQLKSMERVGLFSVGTVKAGMYIFFDNMYWLITGYPSSNKSYEKATLVLCQYKLKWQNANGDIVERWINASSGSKYDIGESETKTITLASDNLILLIPDDEETVNLDGKRVFIDKRPVPTKVYKITRSDDILFDYGVHGGILSFITDRRELNEATDNQELGICDYIFPTTPPENDDETTILSGTIAGTISGNKNLKVGFARTYTANLVDEDGNTVEWSGEFSWNISDGIDVVLTENGNQIELLVEDEDLIDETCVLQVVKTEDNSVITEIILTVIGVF